MFICLFKKRSALVSSNFIFICLVFLILILYTGEPVEHARFSENVFHYKEKRDNLIK